MSDDVRHGTTQLSLPDSTLRVAATQYPRVAIPTLTILYHPALRRIGEHVMLSELLAGRDARISRIQPSFAPPHHSRGTPLAEPHLSRSPFRLRSTGDGHITLSLGECRTRVCVDGDHVRDSVELSPEDVADGVIIELAERVMLLLHWYTQPPDADELGLVGHNKAIVQVREEIRRIAGHDVPVLICGETGVGKELVAAAIHASSRRRDKPLVSVNLAAIPPSLAATELFGAARGAFTGASRAQDGYFRRADGGTLFLDEIGDIPVDVQVTLLRALETGEIYSLGAQRPDQVDIRVVAATDADLEAKVRDGSFRAPLLHRLSGFQIWLPPLRQRRDDISRLLMHFFARELSELGELERLDQVTPAPWLPMSIMKRLLEYPWPGNVRQLRNIARQLVIHNIGYPVMELSSRLFRLLDSDSTDYSIEPTWAHGRTPSSSDTRRRPSDISEDELVLSLRDHRWDVKATAHTLGISRTSLYELIKRSDRIRTVSELSDDEIRRCHHEYRGDLDAMVDRLHVSRRALRRRTRKLGLA